MKASAVIPAYNEEKTIANVVEVVGRVPMVGEVIVVSDGSTDETGKIAEEAGAKVISLPENRGKGGAMMMGVAVAIHPVILFLDADLIGLREKHIYDLLIPVLYQDNDMSIGLFEHGRLATDLAQLVAPYLSGQRAVKKEILEHISDLEITRFGVEVALTRYGSQKGFKVAEVELEDLTHLMKEEKLGLIKGFAARMKMYWEIAKWAKGIKG